MKEGLTLSLVGGSSCGCSNSSQKRNGTVHQGNGGESASVVGLRCLLLDTGGGGSHVCLSLLISCPEAV